ncbi:MAG: iron uptake porin [Microcoleaceae cyanobacterium]
MGGLFSLVVAVQPTSAKLEQFDRYSQEGHPAKIAQITPVSQLSDVYPTDWSFQALQSLVERFGCIAGYPEGTFQGNKALSRYEFAAGLNACLQRLTELLQTTTENRLTEDELISLQRLQNEFAAELSLLRNQIYNLETWADNFNQFSTTTKLQGEAIIALTDSFVNSNQTVLQYRTRLNFKTSFTGEDLLLTQLEMGNAPPFKLNTKEATQTFNIQRFDENQIKLNRLYYKIPVGEQLKLTIAATGTTWDDFVPTINPYLDDNDGGNGTLSAFGQRNPIYRIGGGTGIGLHYQLNPEVNTGIAFSAGYLAANTSDATDGKGLFNGDYAALVQMSVYPTENLQFALTYNHAYSTPGNNGFNNGFLNSYWTGTNIANSIAGLTDISNSRNVVSNSYGIQLAWQIHSKFTLSAWGGYTAARVIDVGDSQIWNYAITLGFPDLFQSGSLGGIVIGREPYLSHFDDSDALEIDFSQDTSWHLEAFYRYQLTDNISITPGFIWITNPNQNIQNDDGIIGTLRTTFSF